MAHLSCLFHQKNNVFSIKTNQEIVFTKLEITKTNQETAFTNLEIIKTNQETAFTNREIVKNNQRITKNTLALRFKH